jgi:hypothetical protein
MSYTRKIRRYSAYYLGWCQAFGEHEIEMEENDNDINWIFGEENIGIIFASRIRKIFFREILGKKHKNSTITLSSTFAQINELRYIFDQEKNEAGLNQLLNLLKTNADIHLFLTYHFCYPPGTRIITFSPKKPLVILYKEIEPLTVRLD